MKKSELRCEIEGLTIRNTRLQYELDKFRPQINRLSTLEKDNASQARLIGMLHLRNLELEDIFSKSIQAKKIGAKK